MEEMNTLKFYRSFFEAINDLEDKDRLALYDAIMRYQFCGEEPNFANKYLKAIWITLVPNIDSANKSVIDGQKGGAPAGNQNAKKQPKTTTLVLEKQPPLFLKNNPSCSNKTTEEEEEEEDKEEVEVEVEDIKEQAPSEQSSLGGVSPNGASVDTPSSDIAKASKHKYGVYQHVLLKDEELQTLKKDYPNWEELINYLDEYIEMKGYKAKSHYLCIRKWVADAVKEQAQKRAKERPIELNRYRSDEEIDYDQFYWQG